MFTIKPIRAHLDKTISSGICFIGHRIKKNPVQKNKVDETFPCEIEREKKPIIMERHPIRINS